MTRYRTAWVLLLSALVFPPATLAVELSLGWLSPHGDGIPTLLLSIVAMILFAGVAANVVGPASAAGPEERSSVATLRVIAITTAILPAALLCGVLTWAAVAGPR